MQRKRIWAPINEKVIPRQRRSNLWNKATTETLKQSLSSKLYSIEIDHDRPSTLPTITSIRCIFFRARSKPIRMLLEILTDVITLTLDWLRPFGIDTK